MHLLRFGYLTVTVVGLYFKRFWSPISFASCLPFNPARGDFYTFYFKATAFQSTAIGVVAFCLFQGTYGSLDSKVNS
jgi:hypothetical protein